MVQGKTNCAEVKGNQILQQESSKASVIMNYAFRFINRQTDALLCSYSGKNFNWRWSQQVLL